MSLAVLWPSHCCFIIFHRRCAADELAALGQLLLAWGLGPVAADAGAAPDATHRSLWRAIVPGWLVNWLVGGSPLRVTLRAVRADSAREAGQCRTPDSRLNGSRLMN